MNHILNSSGLNRHNQVIDNNLYQFESKIKLSLAFGKNWKTILIVFLTILLLSELITWLMLPQIRYDHLSHFGNKIAYVKNLVLGIFFPELVSLFIITQWLKWYHKLLHINYLRLNIKSIVSYQLLVLPALLLAFFVFFPITLHVRFLIREFGHYSLVRYNTIYIDYALNPKIYFLYLPFILVVGYGIINLSLFRDFVANKNIITPTNNDNATTHFTEQHTPAVEIHEEQIEETYAPEASHNYPEVIEVKSDKGEILLRANECLMFKTTGTGRMVEVIHPSGTYRVKRPLASIEQDLDPKVFFKGNKGYVLNFNCVKSYSYWEKGKYIIQVDIPNSEEVLMPRAHLHTLKAGLRERYL